MSEEEEDFDPAELDGGMDAYETAAPARYGAFYHTQKPGSQTVSGVRDGRFAVSGLIVG